MSFWGLVKQTTDTALFVLRRRRGCLIVLRESTLGLHTSFKGGMMSRDTNELREDPPRDQQRESRTHAWPVFHSEVSQCPTFQWKVNLFFIFVCSSFERTSIRGCFPLLSKIRGFRFLIVFFWVHARPSPISRGNNNSMEMRKPTDWMGMVNSCFSWVDWGDEVSEPRRSRKWQSLLKIRGSF